MKESLKLTNPSTPTIHHKLYTQAYFLIHNNSSYMYSFGRRASAVSVAMVLAGFLVYQNWAHRLPAAKPLETPKVPKSNK